MDKDFCKYIFGLIIIIISLIGVGILCSYQEQYCPTHKTVEGHDYIYVRENFVHNPECPKCQIPTN